MLLSRHSVGTYPETSSHATCQETFSQLTQLAELKHSPQILASKEKATTITTLSPCCHDMPLCG